MALSASKQEKLFPPKICIYGEGGIGKTAFATDAEKVIFIPTEEGLSNYPDVTRFPQPQTLEEFSKYLVELRDEPHDFKTLAIDSLSNLEALIWNKVCRESGCKNIEDAAGGYGKGYIEAFNIWREEVLKPLDYLNQVKGMSIILIGHANVKKYDNPLTQSYDRYSMRLHSGKATDTASLIFEWCDVVLFANYFVGITKDTMAGSTKKNPKERVRAIGAGERVLYTEERPAFRAKNRFGLPEQIPFNLEKEHWNILADHIPYYKKQLSNS